MTCLPEKDNDRRRTGEETDLKRSRGKSFGSGFIIGFLSALLCIYAFVFVWVESGRKADTDQESQGASVLTDDETYEKLGEIRNLVEQYYLNDVDSDVLSAYLFKGLAAGLEDDYANYYTAEELRSVQESTRGEYFGIGAVLTMDGENGIAVVLVYEDSPASSAGLQAGDLLKSFNGESLAGKDLTETVSLLRSCEDAFTLTVYRPETEETLDLSMKCGEVEIHNVTWEMKENRIGYIQITEFTNSAVGQFEEAVSDLRAQGMEKLIVDLRNNPGGLLHSVCDILDQVLPEGLMVYTEDKNGTRVEYSSDSSRLIDCEIAVLVNGYSASASEIFAGAIQDYELGPVIGTQTYGKGVVQKTYTLPDGSAFKMTVEKYYTPKGQDIDGNGITPDVIVEEPEDPEEDAEEDAEEDTSDSRETDVVLDRALELLGREEDGE
ncbi:MAG: S41 family peptidase [Candidatus Choladocola sp.]|nr:S41 family peptidase [Candidatus Choladocola sp.]